MITYIVWRLFSILLFVVSVELWYLRRERHSNDDPAKWVTFPVDCDWWTNLQVTEGVQTARPPHSKHAVSRTQSLAPVTQCFSVSIHL